MRKHKRQLSLKKVYYRSFSFLVVVPLLLVFGAAVGIVGYIVRSSAIKTIDAFQANIATTLKNDVKTASLQLSHFAFVNDNEFTRLAAQIYASAPGEQHQMNQQLEKAFRSAMVPSQSIVAGMFYMKDSGSVSMKDNIVVPYQEMRKQRWYQQALADPSMVTIGGYDTSKVNLTANTQKRQQLVLVTAMSPDGFTDKSETVEMLSFFCVSGVSEIIYEAKEHAALGTTVLLDGEGRLVYGDRGNADIQRYFAENTEKFSQDAFVENVALYEGKEKPYFFKTVSAPMTDWKIVTFVENTLLTQAFNKIGAIMAGVIAFLLLMFYVFSRYFLDAIIAPVHTVAEGMNQLVNNNLDVQVVPEGQTEIRTLMESFNQMVLSLKHMLRVNEEAQKRKHSAEMQALQSQINPHFIVNTLNSIRFMAQVAKFDGMRKMAEALINIVSCSFRSNISFYSVREELDVLNSYIYLMRIRYSDGFEVNYKVDEQCLDYVLPRLTLQPIVENAITHGLAGAGEEIGHVFIQVSQGSEFLFLSVRDDGQGMSAERIREVMTKRRAENDNTSIGLENVLARLKLNFGQQAEMLIQSEVGKFTQVTIKLPLLALKKLDEQHTETEIIT